jgi:hypothetical protein
VGLQQSCECKCTKLHYSHYQAKQGFVTHTTTRYTRTHLFPLEQPLLVHRPGALYSLVLLLPLLVGQLEPLSPLFLEFVLADLLAVLDLLGTSLLLLE